MSKKTKHQKEQRVIIVIDETKDGKMNINLSFHPKLASKEEFEKLTMKAKELQCAGADIGKYVMQSLAKDREGTFKGKK